MQRSITALTQKLEQHEQCGRACDAAPHAAPADDNAPPARKTRWLAIFFLCIPTGYALGYIFGGLAAAGLGWRAPFLLMGAAMAPFVVFCLRCLCTFVGWKL